MSGLIYAAMATVADFSGSITTIVSNYSKIRIRSKYRLFLVVCNSGHSIPKSLFHSKISIPRCLATPHLPSAILKNAESLEVSFFRLITTKTLCYLS